MNFAEQEKDELKMIYESNFKVIDKDTFSIKLQENYTEVEITFRMPKDYPNSPPDLSVAIHKGAETDILNRLKDIAKSMIGVCMCNFIISELLQILSGVESKFENTEEQLAKTPFSVDRLSVWYKEFNRKKKESQKVSERMTGKQYFELNKGRDE